MAIQNITGRAYWARVLPDQLHDTYDGDAKEWSLDVSVDDKTVEKLTKLGLGSKIKNKGDDRGNFITFSRNELKAAGPKKGQPNNPIRVTTDNGETAWDDRKIGNGSFVSVDFNIFETHYKNKSFLKPAILSIDVINWVEYMTGAPQSGRRKASTQEESWDGDVV